MDILDGFTFYKRKDFFKHIFESENHPYVKFPIYKTCLIIARENPEMTSKQIVEKYFDPFRGRTVAIIDLLPRNVDMSKVEYIYKSENIPEEELLVSIDTSKSNIYYLNYAEYNYSYGREFTIGNWWNRYPSLSFDKCKNASDAVFLLERLPLMSYEEQRKELGDMILNMAINVDKEERQRMFEAIDEYAITKEKLLLALNTALRKIEEEYCYTTECYHPDAYLRRFLDKTNGCPICGCYINVNYIDDFLFYDTTDKLIAEECSVCKDFTMTFTFDKNRNRVYCHKKCKRNLNITRLYGLKIKDLDTVIVSNRTEKMIREILERNN